MSPVGGLTLGIDADFMAQQAILAAHRRRRKAKGGAFSTSDGNAPVREKSRFNPLLSNEEKVKVMELRCALKDNSNRLHNLFQIWDEDGSGEVNETEFANMCRMLGIKTEGKQLKTLMKMCDLNGGGTIALKELMQVVEDTPGARDMDMGEASDAEKRNILVRGLQGLYRFINTTVVQSLLYFSFVIIFQMLTVSLRAPEEYYLDKMFSDTFVENAFDAALNEFKVTSPGPNPRLQLSSPYQTWALTHDCRSPLLTRPGP